MSNGIRRERGIRRRSGAARLGALAAQLRWAGLEEDAKRLELAVSTLPPEERGTVGFGPFSTDQAPVPRR